MKHIITTILTLILLVACKNNTKTETVDTVETEDSTAKTAKQSDGLTLIKGDFIFIDGAAVLQTQTGMYGIFVDDKMHELNKLVQQYKNAPTDMVPVEIRGIITTDKKDEKILWKNKIEIKEILNVYKPSKDKTDVIKLDS